MLSITRYYPTPPREELDFEPTGLSVEIFDNETFFTYERQLWRELDSGQLFVQIKKVRVFLEPDDILRAQAAMQQNRT